MSSLYNQTYAWWLLTILLLLAPLPAGAQVVSEDDISIRHFGTNQGLPSRTVLGSVRDSFGLLWVATERGIRRLDGHQVAEFPNCHEQLKGPLTLGADNLIYSPHPLYRDSVEILDPVALKTTGIRLGGPAQGHFAGTYQCHGSPLFYLRGGGIYTLGKEGKTDRSDLFSADHQGAGAQVHELRGEAKIGDRLVHASNSGYTLYRSATREIEILQDGVFTRHQLPTIQDYPTLHQDRSGGIWASGARALFHKPASAKEFSRQAPLAEGNPVNLINEDQQGNVILAFLDDRYKRITQIEIVSQGQRRPANYLIEEDDRIISFTGQNFLKRFRIHAYGGLLLYNIRNADATPFRRYLYDPNVASGQFGHVMRGFTSDDDGNVYVNKDSGNPYWFRVRATDLGLDTLTLLDNDGSVSGTFGCGTNMLNYQGDIWGHNCDYYAHDANTGDFTGFVYRYRPTDDSWRRWQVPDTNQVVRWLDFGRTEGEFLVITEKKFDGSKGNLYYFYPATGDFKRILPTGPDYFIQNNTKSAVFDSTRNGWWIGTSARFYLFDVESERLTAFPIAEDVNGGVSDILPLPNGRLLLSTFQYGLQVFDPETGETKQAGGVPTQRSSYADDFMILPSNEIATIARTEQKQLLVASFDGLTVHGSNSKDFTYTTLEGLPSNEFNTPSLYRNPSDGRWYAGGINGFVSFRAEDLDPPPSVYAPAITALRTFDSKEDDSEEQYTPIGGTIPERIELPYSNSYFGFDFAIPDFMGASDRRYQTFLEGHDPNWRLPTTEASVIYTDLRPGEYTFHLKAFDGNRFESEQQISLDIIVFPHWTATWWARLLFMGLIALVLYRIYVFRMNQLRKDLEAERKVNSLELRALRQQLNPHFISNSLGAIGRYVKKQKPERAAAYLNDFRLVMRSFLEASRAPYISLEEEISILDRYIRLEQLQNPGKFTYRINVDPDIDRQMDVVPSLLLQPIIENAINHGFRTYDTGGELVISFEPAPTNEDLMVVTIFDNGVGRKIAGQREHTRDHISRATEILEDRLAILNQEGDEHVELTVRDLHPDQEHTGTVVRIVFERG